MNSKCSHEHKHDREHGHCHEHKHGHCHEHKHGHCHEHKHGHCHEHGHKHEHAPGCTESGEREELSALLVYTLAHNHHHVDELEDVVRRLTALNLTEEAGLLRGAIEEYIRGNEIFADVVKRLKE